MPSSALAAGTGAPAEPGEGAAAVGFASAWATQGGREGEAGARLASPHPAVPVFLLHLLLFLSGSWLGTGSQGWAEAHGGQKEGVWLLLLSGGHGDTGRGCSQHRCGREDGGVAAGLVTAQILLQPLHADVRRGRRGRGGAGFPHAREGGKGRQRDFCADRARSGHNAQ